MRLVLRDPSHAVRIACRDPLAKEERFGAQWEHLVGDKNSVLATIQNSDKLRARLEACQRRVLRHDQHQGGGLTSILRHVGYVQPRFESFVAPRRRYICMLQAIAMLCASIADDPRSDAHARKVAEDALDHMTAEDTLAGGLAADFCEVCLVFLRAFDVDDHGPARTATQEG